MKDDEAAVVEVESDEAGRMVTLSSLVVDEQSLSLWSPTTWAIFCLLFLDAISSVMYQYMVVSWR